MSNFWKVFLISIVGAFLNIAFSNLFQINIIWILVIVLLMTENDDIAIPFAISGGILSDILLHNSVGITTLSILVGIGMVLIVRAVFSGDNIYFRIFSVVFSFIIAFAFDAVMSIFIDGTKYSGVGDYFYWWKYVISHTLVAEALILLIGGTQSAVNTSKKIKLR